MGPAKPQDAGPQRPKNFVDFLHARARWETLVIFCMVIKLTGLTAPCTGEKFLCHTNYSSARSVCGS